MKNRILITVVFMFSTFFSPGAWPADRKSEMVVVYWGAKDCRWCTYWEGSLSGDERRFRASEEFKKIKFYVLKSDRLADKYVREHYPPDVLWLYERIEQGVEKSASMRPSWYVYVDRKRVATFSGQSNWEKNHFPEIKKLVADKTFGSVRQKLGFSSVLIEEGEVR